MKRNSSGCPSSMFFESQSARGPEKVVNLFVEFFQGDYVNEGELVLLPTLDTLPDEDTLSSSGTQQLRRLFWG
jgi:hypothetical protein